MIIISHLSSLIHLFNFCFNTPSTKGGSPRALEWEISSLRLEFESHTEILRRSIHTPKGTCKRRRLQHPKQLKTNFQKTKKKHQWSTKSKNLSIFINCLGGEYNSKLQYLILYFQKIRWSCRKSLGRRRQWSFLATTFSKMRFALQYFPPSLPSQDLLRTFSSFYLWLINLLID